MMMLQYTTIRTTRLVDEVDKDKQYYYSRLWSPCMWRQETRSRGRSIGW